MLSYCFLYILLYDFITSFGSCVYSYKSLGRVDIVLEGADVKPVMTPVDVPNPPFKLTFIPVHEPNQR